MDYRKEIDGLRAVAVISVVFCHAGFSGFSGGFVGVDVFFVISGFLITSIIYEETRTGSFSLLAFYERRIRRIFPALFTILFLTTCFAWYWLWPEDFRNYAKSLVYVATFASNIHFYKEIGYFAPDVDLRPLLHTWSLGVEEQYYIFFPLIFLFFHRYGRRVLLAVFSLILLTSLGLAQYGLSHFPDATFYLLPTRAWELLVGAICALIVAWRPSWLALGLAVRNAGSLAGAAMIAAAVVLFNEKTPFPGLSALFPVVGAALIIMTASAGTWLHKVLVLRPVQVVGLWSYSIYLWHQPIFAFARYRDEDPGALLFSVLIAVVLLLSYLTWRYVETPFRKMKIQRARLWRYALGGIFVVLLIGLAGKHRYDYLKRFSPGYEAQLVVDQMLRKNYGLDRDCDELTAREKCQTDAAAPEILVWGDSHAMHLVNAVLAAKPGVKLVQRAKSGCGPFLDIAPLFDGNLAGSRECLEFNRGVIEWLRQTPSIRQVFVASVFSQYLSESIPLLKRSGEVGVLPGAEVEKAFVDTMNLLRSLNVTPVIFAPAPANGADMGRCLARSVLLGRDLDYCNFAERDNLAVRFRAYEFLESLRDEYRIVWLHKLMCHSGICQTHADGVFFFLDEGHLSRQGSSYLGKKHDLFSLIGDGSALGRQGAD